MSLPNRLINYISESEYLEDEKHREFKCEYIDGEIYMMAGAGKNHQRIITMLSRRLCEHFDGTPCEAFSSDTKIRADKGRKYFYPDVVVACEKEDDSDYVESPRIIVEVLSESTRKYDKTFKRLVYQSIPSLEEYVLIEQDSVKIEISRKSENWATSVYFLGDDVQFESIDLMLSVADIYQRVENEEMQLFRQNQAVL
jgi:Uma2 family endonuclease